MSTPTTEPTTIVAGDTAKWLKTLPDYSAADGWTLTYTLVSPAQRYTFTATASGADHLVTVAASTTALWVAATYTWRAQASKAGEVYTVGSGQVVVQPTFSAATDARSSAQKGLDAIKAYLIDSNNWAAAHYEIAGRNLKRYTMAELLALESRFAAEVKREQDALAIGNGLSPSSRIYVRHAYPGSR